jgi:hypothetical protein
VTDPLRLPEWQESVVSVGGWAIPMPRSQWARECS